MTVWKFKIQEEIVKKSAQDSYHPVIDALLNSRGYRDEESRQRFLFPNFDRDIHDPFLFRQMRRVVDRIGEAKKNNEKIGIFGDFDADGVTSSVIIRETLEALGISCEVYIPEKINEGHGFNILAVDFFEQKKVTLILTLDCGMTNHEAITEAKKRNIATIVVDHHHVPEILPDAFAIINPKIATETYPFQELCGAGTSFKLAQALFMEYLPEKKDQLKWILDVVAIGTVADVMPLIGENRVIVKYGLIVLSKTRRVGLQEMFSVGRIKIDEDNLPDAHTIGFQIAPRINAASRMAHALLAHNLLIEKERVQARILALELDAWNVERQKISATTTDQVRAIAIEKYQKRKFIFALDENFPFGIIGLVAGRIAHEFHKPTCVLTRGETESRGSFRSIPELNVIEIIEQCGDLLKKFGGHSQAAGMTIENKNLDAFYEKFDALATSVLENVVTEPEIIVDMKIIPEHITSALCHDLKLLAPFGEGNPEPIFALENMFIYDVRFVGNGEKHIKLRLGSSEKNGKIFDAIGFSFGETFPDLQVGETLDILFHISENTWNGSTTVQLKLVDIHRKNVS